MHIASREKPSHFESSQKELSLKTTKTRGNEKIKQTLSESGPESLLASHGKYSHTRTFAVGPAKRAVLAFSEEKQRVDGFVLNKDQQLVPIKPHDLPKELRAILSSEAFDAFLNDIHARLTQLSNGDFRLALHQGLKGGVYSKKGNINKIQRTLDTISMSGRYASRIIIQNKSSGPLLLKNGTACQSFAENHPRSAFLYNTDLNLYTMPPKTAGGIFVYSLIHTCGDYTNCILSFLVNDYTVLCATSMCHERYDSSSPKKAHWIRNRIKIQAGDGSGMDVVGFSDTFFNGLPYCRAENKSLYSSEYSPGEPTSRKILVTCESTFVPPYRGDCIFTFLDLNSAIPREIPVKNENEIVPAAQNKQNMDVMDIHEIVRQLTATIDLMQKMLDAVKQMQGGNA